MAQNGLKWLKMTQNCLKWLEMAPIDTAFQPKGQKIFLKKGSISGFF